MGAADATYAGFADLYIPELMWTELIHRLEASGTVDALSQAAKNVPDGTIEADLPDINRLFGNDSLNSITAALQSDTSDFAVQTLAKLSRASPLSAAYTIEMMNRLRSPGTTMADALDLEYRFTSRASEHGDFLEGIRAAIIDKRPRPQLAIQ